MVLSVHNVHEVRVDGECVAINPIDHHMDGVYRGADEACETLFEVVGRALPEPLDEDWAPMAEGDEHEGDGDPLAVAPELQLLLTRQDAERIFASVLLCDGHRHS
jgi:hypothetical protein